MIECINKQGEQRQKERRRVIVSNAAPIATIDCLFAARQLFRFGASAHQSRQSQQIISIHTFIHIAPQFFVPHSVSSLKQILDMKSFHQTEKFLVQQRNGRQQVNTERRRMNRGEFGMSKVMNPRDLHFTRGSFYEEKGQGKEIKNEGGKQKNGENWGRTSPGED